MHILLLKRLSYPCRLSHMVPLLGRKSTEICDIKLRTRLYLISSLVLGTKIFYSRINWQNCFGSVDGTVLRIFRPKINQNIVYNGHKRAHGIKFQSLPLPNELIGNFSGPYVGKRDDSTMTHESGLLSIFQRSVLA